MLTPIDRLYDPIEAAIKRYSSHLSIEFFLNFIHIYIATSTNTNLTYYKVICIRLAYKLIIKKKKKEYSQYKIDT